MTQQIWKVAYHSLSQQLQAWGKVARQAGMGAVLSVPFTVVWADTAAPHWINFAQQFGAELEQHVHHQDSGAAQRLADWANGENQAQLGPVEASFWVATDGSLRDMRLETLHDSQADADLRELLQSMRLRFAPPPDMPQPLRLSLQWSYD